jgi:hypothetical protein
MTADEKVNELAQLLDYIQMENSNLKVQVESSAGGDKVAFVREKIDDLVHKEVQLKLNNIAASTGNPHLMERELYQKGEELNNIKGQLDHVN